MAFNKIFSPTVGLNFWELLVSETAVKAGLLMKKAFARPVARGCKVMETAKREGRRGALSVRRKHEDLYRRYASPHLLGIYPKNGSNLGWIGR